MIKVKVYKNLKKDIFSIQDYKTRKVIGYSDNLRLENANFVVSEKTRQRVIKEGKKYVHAFVVGDMVTNWELTEQFETVRYNPYMFDFFLLTEKNILQFLKIGKEQSIYLEIVHQIN